MTDENAVNLEITGNGSPIYMSNLRPTWAQFEPSLENLSYSLRDQSYIAFCGQNGSGKTSLLKGLSAAYGAIRTPFIGTQRFINELRFAGNAIGDTGRGAYISLESDSNTDGFAFNHQSFIRSYRNDTRQRLFDACEFIVGARIEMARTDPDNEMSEWEISINGQDIKKASTGTRLILRLVIDCMDPNIEKLFIDEPELGLSPIAQRKLHNLLHDPDLRSKYLPHISTIMVGTHSHLFLNKTDIGSNYSVKLDGSKIISTKIATVQLLNQLQLNLLGNQLDAYSLPEAIVIVEGISDLAYIRRVVAQKYPEKNIVVASSEGNPRDKVRAFAQLIGPNAKSPYFGRTFVILDKILHGTTRATIAAQGISAENVIQWERNGIEYLYPIEFMTREFCCSETDLNNMQFEDGDNVTIGAVTHRKKDLGERAAAHVNKDTIYPNEFREKFLDKLDAAISVV